MPFTPSPLPPAPPYERSTMRPTDIDAAYNMCLTLEQAILNDNLDSMGRDDRDLDLVKCRILGWLLHHLQNETGFNLVIQEISATLGSRGSLLALGQTYLEHFIPVIKTVKGRTPVPSGYVSTPSFDRISEMETAMLAEPPTSHLTAKSHALVRDGYKCCILGAFDLKYCDINTELMQRAEAADIPRARFTHCIHIFDESANARIYNDPAESEYTSGTVWTPLQRFGYSSVPEELHGENIHRLENILTLDSSTGSLFDALLIWFVPIAPEEHKYEIRAVDDDILIGLPRFLTFTTPDPVNLPVPSPDYLAIHATCEAVAHKSGAFKHIDKVLAEMETRGVLAEDGSSTDILDYAIRRKAMCV